MACGGEEGQLPPPAVGGHPGYGVLRYEWQVGSLGKARAQQKPQSKISDRVRSRISRVPLSGTCGPVTWIRHLCSVAPDRYTGDKGMRGQSLSVQSVCSTCLTSSAAMTGAILVCHGKVKRIRTPQSTTLKAQALQAGNKAWSWGQWCISKKKESLGTNCPLSHLSYISL